MSSVMISCGEASGDLYAGALAQELARLDPAARVFGFGGDHLAAAGAELLGDYRGLAVTGLVEAVRVLPRSLAMYRRLVAAARDRRPDVFVAIDFPDFNFRLAGALRRLGVPVVYYVSPQIWAWRRGRMRTMKRIADRVLVIFPFEEAIYAEAGVAVEFVGHPLVDLARASQPRNAFLMAIGLDPAAPTVALLPGSRPNEVRQILPVLARARELVADRVPGVQFVVARAPHLDAALFAPLASSRLGMPATVESRTDDVLAASDVVITASGTATVQAALHERPMVIVYRLSPLTYKLGKRFVLVDMYGMVNLVAGRRVVPELIQEGLTAEAVAQETIRYLTDADHRERTRKALGEVVVKLGAGGASRRAAEAVLRVAHQATAVHAGRP